MEHQQLDLLRRPEESLPDGFMLATRGLRAGQCFSGMSEVASILRLPSSRVRPQPSGEGGGAGGGACEHNICACVSHAASAPTRFPRKMQRLFIA